MQSLISRMQPRPVAAIDLIADEPVRYINERIAVCDGGNPGIPAPTDAN